MKNYLIIGIYSALLGFFGATCYLSGQYLKERHIKTVILYPQSLPWFPYDKLPCTRIDHRLVACALDDRMEYGQGNGSELVTAEALSDIHAQQGTISMKWKGGDVCMKCDALENCTNAELKVCKP